MENTAVITDLLDFFYVNEKQLTARQLEFIEGCKRHFKINNTLSEKQISVLNDIKKYHSKTEQRYTMKVI